MKIFLREFRTNLKSLLIWSGIAILFSTVGFSKFSAFYENPQLVAVLDSMPPALLSALDMNSFNLTTVTGFFGIMDIYFSLILSISAVMWGSDIISKEERDKTVEFSLTLPVKRSSLISGKAAAVLVNCILLLLVTWGTTLALAQDYQPDSTFYHFVALNMQGYFFLQLIFMAVGIFLGCIVKKYKKAGSLAVSLLLGSYFLSILIEFSTKLDFLKYATPFKYFEASVLLQESKLDISSITLSLGLTFVLFIGAYFSYSKRDLYI